MSGAARAFEALHRGGVPYCLWRGTPRLDRAWSGRGDFDLLVAAEALPALTEALSASDFKLARTAPGRTAPRLHDWLGLERPAGPLHHLHVHEALRVGEPRLYRYRLPFEREVLERRRPVDSPRTATPLWYADPVDEAALLLVRCALQLRWRDRLPIGTTGVALQAKLDHDLRVLMAEVSIHEQRARGRITERVVQWLGPAAARPLTDLPRVDTADLGALRGVASRALAESTSQGDAAAVLEGARRSVGAVRRRLGARVGPRLPLLLPPVSRTGPAGARTLGFGGAGRDADTVASAVGSLLGGKLDVVVLPERGPLERRLGQARAANAKGWVALCALTTAEAERLRNEAWLALHHLPPQEPPEQRLDRALGFVWAQL